MKYFDPTIYSNEFFEWHVKYTIEYNKLLTKWLIMHFKRKSLVDFGCGIGTMLEVAKNIGLKKIKGYEYFELAKKYSSQDIKELVEYVDCSLPLVTDKFDCVVSIEVAEHIEPSNTDTFICNLVDALDHNGILFFTAAPIGQGGHGHINCRDLSEWVDMFESKGLFFNNKTNNMIKEKIIEFKVPPYIIRNWMTFTHENNLDNSL